MSLEVKKLCEEIKAKYSLSDYIASKGLEVNSSGFINCIFHDEKTGSLRINKGDKYDWFHCFGCGKSGTIIDFYAEMEGISEGKAIHELSKGIDFSFNLSDIQKDLFEDNTKEKENLEDVNIMISAHSFRYLRKVRKNLSEKILKHEFEKVDTMLKMLDKSIREENEENVMSIYRKVCVEDFFIKRYDGINKSLE